MKQLCTNYPEGPMPYLTRAEVAAHLGISTSDVLRLGREKVLECVRFGRQLRYTGLSVDVVAEHYPENPMEAITHMPIPIREVDLPKYQSQTLLTCQQVAQRLNISLDALRYLNKCNRLTSIRVNERVIRYDPKTVERFLDQHRFSFPPESLQETK